MKKIKVIYPDESSKEFPSGVTPLEIAKDISNSLAKKIICSKINDELYDINRPIESNCNFKLFTENDLESQDVLLHSTAHLMAQAIKELFPSSKIAIGPALKDRFYYDIDLDEKINEETLVVIERKMHEISKRNYEVKRYEYSVKEAKEIFSQREETYKLEIINQIDPNDLISAYKQGDFIDLCRGPHIHKVNKIKYFKLLTVAGAYWRADESNKMLQRIYGTAWFSKEKLDEFLNMLEESKKRDHRKIGKELNLFTFDDEIGSGLPLWLPNGNIIVEELENLAKETETDAGYDRVRTPHITKGILYEKSGHLSHYKDSMFPAMDIDGNEYFLKPMNCPHHHKIYASIPKTYKDLPVRLAEYGTCYRYEKSGQLFGLMRVRSMQMNDAHIYCTEEQFKEEFLSVCKMYLKYFDIFNIEKYEMRLSLHDPKKLGKKYVNEPELWIKTENLVREALKEGNLNFIEIEGEAAFYGPKIDVQVWSTIGREFTLATNQVDFAIPQKFDLTYKDSNDKDKTPLCIHRAPLGTHERFIGFLIEHFAGDFPLWLAPKQAIILPISNKFNSYANKIYKKLREYNIRVDVDLRDEKVGAKIRKAELSKIPIMLIIGEKEKNDSNLSVRRRKVGDIGTISIDKFITDCLNEIKNKELIYSRQKI